MEEEKTIIGVKYNIKPNQPGVKDVFIFENPVRMSVYPFNGIIIKLGQNNYRSITDVRDLIFEEDAPRELGVRVTELEEEFPHWAEYTPQSPIAQETSEYPEGWFTEPEGELEPELQYPEGFEYPEGWFTEPEGELEPERFGGFDPEPSFGQPKRFEGFDQPEEFGGGGFGGGGYKGWYPEEEPRRVVKKTRKYLKMPRKKIKAVRAYRYLKPNHPEYDPTIPSIKYKNRYKYYGDEVYINGLRYHWVRSAPKRRSHYRRSQLQFNW